MKKIIISMILLSSCTVDVKDKADQYQQPAATVQAVIPTDTAVIIHRQALPKVLVIVYGKEEIGGYHSQGFFVQHFATNSNIPVAVMVKY